MDYRINYPDQERLVAVFDESMFKISRLHNDWLRCKEYRERGNLRKLRWKLDSIYLELAEEMKRVDVENKNTNLQKSMEKLNDEIDIHVVSRKLGLLYRDLLKKEELLRHIQQEAGMGARHKSTTEDEME